MNEAAVIDRNREVKHTRAPEMLEALRETCAQLEHEVPGSCWANGPSTGDIIEDYVVCPGCRALANARIAIRKAESEITAVLERGWKRIEDPDKWCQGEYARTREGVKVFVGDAAAYRFCASGSVIVQISRVQSEALDFLHLAANEMGEPSADELNDNRDHAAVRRMYEIAIAKSKEVTA